MKAVEAGNAEGKSDAEIASEAMNQAIRTTIPGIDKMRNGSESASEALARLSQSLIRTIEFFQMFNFDLIDSIIQDDSPIQEFISERIGVIKADVANLVNAISSVITERLKVDPRTGTGGFIRGLENMNNVWKAYDSLNFSNNYINDRGSLTYLLGGRQSRTAEGSYTNRDIQGVNFLLSSTNTAIKAFSSALASGGDDLNTLFANASLELAKWTRFSGDLESVKEDNTNQLFAEFYDYMKWTVDHLAALTKLSGYALDIQSKMESRLASIYRINTEIDGNETAAAEKLQQLQQKILEATGKSEISAANRRLDTAINEVVRVLNTGLGSFFEIVNSSWQTSENNRFAGNYGGQGQMSNYMKQFFDTIMETLGITWDAAANKFIRSGALNPDFLIKLITEGPMLLTNFIEQSAWQLSSAYNTLTDGIDTSATDWEAQMDAANTFYSNGLAELTALQGSFAEVILAAAELLTIIRKIQDYQQQTFTEYARSLAGEGSYETETRQVIRDIENIQIQLTQFGVDISNTTVSNYILALKQLKLEEVAANEAIRRLEEEREMLTGNTAKLRRIRDIWVSLFEDITKSIEEITIGEKSLYSTSGRENVLSQQITRLFSQFTSSSDDEARANIGRNLYDTIQERLNIASSEYDRGDPRYAAIISESLRMLNTLRDAGLELEASTGLAISESQLEKLNSIDDTIDQVRSQLEELAKIFLTLWGSEDILEYIATGEGSLLEAAMNSANIDEEIATAVWTVNDSIQRLINVTTNEVDAAVAKTTAEYNRGADYSGTLTSNERSKGQSALGAGLKNTTNLGNMLGSFDESTSTVYNSVKTQDTGYRSKINDAIVNAGIAAENAQVGTGSGAMTTMANNIVDFVTEAKDSWDPLKSTAEQVALKLANRDFSNTDKVLTLMQGFKTSIGDNIDSWNLKVTSWEGFNDLSDSSAFLNALSSDSVEVSKAVESFKGLMSTKYKLATGGYITGPGTATSDSIPAMLSNGEYVIRADSVAKYGPAFLDKLNAGTLDFEQRFMGGFIDNAMCGGGPVKPMAEGGPVISSPVSNTSNTNNNSNTTNNISLNVSVNVENATDLNDPAKVKEWARNFATTIKREIARV
jgi:hypothetical protein